MTDGAAGLAGRRTADAAGKWEMRMARLWLAGMALAAPPTWTVPAAAQGTLNLYCSAQIG